MPPFILTVLKAAFLALLYLFVYRAVRSVAVDLRAARAAPAAAPARRRRSTGKGPRSVVVIDERGSKRDPVRLEGAVQVGRGESCQIRLSDTYASTMHARIFQRDGEWAVEDLGSTNGTYLNQRRVTSPAAVQAGDTIRIGKTTLELRR